MPVGHIRTYYIGTPQYTILVYNETTFTVRENGCASILVILDLKIVFRTIIQR